MKGRSAFVTNDVMDELAGHCFCRTAGLDKDAQEGELTLAPGYVEYRGVTIDMVLDLMDCLERCDGWDPNDGFGRKLEIAITRKGQGAPATPPSPGTPVVNPGTPVANPGTPAPPSTPTP